MNETYFKKLMKDQSMDEIYLKKIINDTAKKLSNVITNELKEIFILDKYLLVNTLIKVHKLSLNVELEALCEIRPEMEDDIKDFLEKFNEFIFNFEKNNENKH